MKKQQDQAEQQESREISGIKWQPWDSRQPPFGATALDKPLTAGNFLDLTYSLVASSQYFS